MASTPPFRSLIILAISVFVTLRAVEVPATLDAVHGCSSNNWGQPHQKRPPSRVSYIKEIQEKCREPFAAHTTMADTLERGMVNFYPDTDSFDKFVGEDWVPENNYLFPASTPHKKHLDPTKAKPGSMLGRTCETKNDDNSQWSVTRVGPFFTTGGYDWVQVGWDNVFDLEKILKNHPEGIFVLEQFSGAVSSDGTRLSNPPIHIHHIHVGPKPGIRQRTDNYKCVMEGEGCYDPTRVLEHHGDYQGFTTDPAGGLDLLSETVPDGYGKFITFPLGLEGDMNDVRAANSEPLEWYYELGIRWVPRVDKGVVSKIKPMHFHNFAGPGDFKPSHQNTLIFTYQCPTDHDSLFWYTGRMPYSGELLRNKFHAHNKIFKEAIFFAATPEELGLTTATGLRPSQPYLTVDINKAGFESLDEVKSFVLSNLERSKRAHHARLNSTGKTGFSLKEERYSREEPRSICQGVSVLEEVEGYFYDRSEPTCCLPWHIEKGDIFTVLGFNKKLTYELGPHSDAHPATFPGHVGWWLSVASEELDPPVSRFSLEMYNQDPNGAVNFHIADLYKRIEIVFNQGTPGQDNVMLRNFVVIPLVTVLQNAIVFGFLLVLAIALGIRRCCVQKLKSGGPTTYSGNRDTNKGFGAYELIPTIEGITRRLSAAIPSTGQYKV